MPNADALEISKLLNGLTEEDWFLFERSEQKKSEINESAMLRIQSLVGWDRGWSSEREMLEDMAEFRRARGA